VRATYETHARGIRIVPGQWRPHYPFEQIAWVSPPWPSQEYIWLDFPEAIFSDSRLLFLSHVNPAYPALFPDLPKVPWRTTAGSLSFERTLPNEVHFAGALVRNGDSALSLELSVDNRSDEPLKEIRVQTCAYLRGIKEFSDCTAQNKFVHVPGAGWQSFGHALLADRETGRFRLGWRGGRRLADLPVMVTRSSQAERIVAMTWYDDTFALVSNPKHPCMHADPAFPDLEPGQKVTVRGELLFFAGAIDEFAAEFERRYREGFHRLSGGVRKSYGQP